MDTLKTQRIHDVVTVTLSRPAARNAINLAMCDEIIQLFTDFQSDDTLRLVVIQGEGPVFSAGIDMHEVKARSDSAEWYVARRNRGLDAYLAIEACPAPVVASVRGAVVGGGCEIAAAADFVFAAEGTTFKYPEALFGAVGATQRLPRRAGAAMAKELLFTGRTVSGEEAFRVGIINRFVPIEELEAALAQLVHEVSKADLAAVRAIKQAINRGIALPMKEAVDIERHLIEQGVTGPGWRQGAAQFSASIGRGNSASS